MEVLEEGKDVKWRREIVCPHCKSRMLVTAADIMYDYSKRFTYNRYYIICHGHRIYLSGKYYEEKYFYYDIPEHVKKNARWRAKRETELRIQSAGKVHYKKIMKSVIWFVVLGVAFAITYTLACKIANLYNFHLI